jgi:hypothetical protein
MYRSIDAPCIKHVRLGQHACMPCGSVGRLALQHVQSKVNYGLGPHSPSPFGRLSEQSSRGANSTAETKACCYASDLPPGRQLNTCQWYMQDQYRGSDVGCRPRAMRRSVSHRPALLSPLPHQALGALARRINPVSSCTSTACMLFGTAGLACYLNPCLALCPYRG